MPIKLSQLKKNQIMKRLALAICYVSTVIITSSEISKAQVDKKTNTQNLGFIKINERKYQEAIQIFTEQIDKGKKDADIYFGRGKAWQELGENEKAFIDYSKSIQIKTNNPKSYSNRGLTRGAEGQFKEAIKDFDNAISQDKNYKEAYLNRSVAKGVIRDWKGAEQDLTKAINLDKNYASAWRNRGIVREAIGNMLGACNDWVKAAKLGDEEAKNWFVNQCK